MKTHHQKADRVFAEAIGWALDAEFKGEPKQWFLLKDDSCRGVKLGIGMFNPGICRIADLFYLGEPSEAILVNAQLIVEAVNACFRVNSRNPRFAAAGYDSVVRACQNVVALEMSDAWHEPVVRQVIEIVSNALDQARRSS